MSCASALAGARSCKNTKKNGTDEKWTKKQTQSESNAFRHYPPRCQADLENSARSEMMAHIKQRKKGDDKKKTLIF